MAGIPPSLTNVASNNVSANVDASTHPSVIQTFKNRVAKFWNVYTSLQNKADIVPAAMKDQYDTLMNRGGYIRSTIETLTNTYDEVSNWLSDVSSYFGFNGLNPQLGNLGFAVTVPLAIVVGASALIVKWLSDAYAMNRKLDAIQKLKSQGYDAQQAANIVNKTTAGGSLISFDFLQKPITITGIVVVSLWFANKKGWI